MTKLISVLFAAALFGCVTSFKKSSDRRPAQSSDDNPMVSTKPLATIPANQYLTYDRFKNLLITKHVQRIQDAIPLLVEMYPDYFQFYTLSYNSFSLHASTFESPRVIVSGPDARFLLTFNGGLPFQGGASIEVAQYSDQKHTFEFREISFKNDGLDMKNLDLAPAEIEWQTPNLVVSKPNPQVCQSCHGANSNPIFRTYFTWPGFYGSDDDMLGFSFAKQYWNPNNEAFFSTVDRPHSTGRQMLLDGADTELEGYISYLKGKPTHPRYKWLPTTFVETGLLAYMAGKPFSELDFSDLANSLRQKYSADSDWPHRPVFVFSEMLQKLNQDRIVHVLESKGLQGAYQKLKWTDLTRSEKDDSSYSDPLGRMAQKIYDTISTYNFKNKKPTLADVRKALETNVRDEFGVIREKLGNQADNLKPSVLKFYPYPGGQADAKIGSEWAGPSTAFYSKIVGLKKLTEMDKLAVHYEGDDQVVVTAVALLLLDSGVNLSDFSINLRQESLSFHEDGLARVYAYLGLPIK